MSAKRSAGLAKYIRKGTFVSVVGRLIQEEYVTRDGEKKKALGVWIDDMEFYNDKGTRLDEPAAHAPEVERFLDEPSDLDLEDIPF